MRTSIRLRTIGMRASFPPWWRWRLSSQVSVCFSIAAAAAVAAAMVTHRRQTTHTTGQGQFLDLLQL